MDDRVLHIPQKRQHYWSLTIWLFRPPSANRADKLVLLTIVMWGYIYLKLCNCLKIKTFNMSRVDMPKPQPINQSITIWAMRQVLHSLGKTDCILCRGKTKCLPPKKKRVVVSMGLNCIWWWDSSSGDLGNMEYLFIVIISRSALIWSRRWTLLGFHLLVR